MWLSFYFLRRGQEFPYKSIFDIFNMAFACLLFFSIGNREAMYLSYYIVGNFVFTNRSVKYE